jgi:hypothetical protein
MYLDLGGIYLKVVYSVLKSIMHSFGYVSVLPNRLQASIFYIAVHLVCKYIRGSNSVYIISYQFKIVNSSLKYIDRIYF